MPLPLVFIGIAAVTGATGAVATVKAGVDQLHAKNINYDADQKNKIQQSGRYLFPESSLYLF